MQALLEVGNPLPHQRPYAFPVGDGKSVPQLLEEARIRFVDEWARQIVHLMQRLPATEPQEIQLQLYEYSGARFRRRTDSVLGGMHLKNLERPAPEDALRFAGRYWYELVWYELVSGPIVFLHEPLPNPFGLANVLVLEHDPWYGVALKAEAHTRNWGENVRFAGRVASGAHHQSAAA